MIWWFLVLGVSTLVVVCVVIALYMRVRQHMQGKPFDSGAPDDDHHA